MKTKYIDELIDINSNDFLSKMDKYDLNELLRALNYYPLELRKLINIDKSFTFGLELESEYANTFIIKKDLAEKKLVDNWFMKSDKTLRFGTEVVSKILNDNELYWEELKEVCKILEQHSHIGSNCGGHIHINSSSLENNNTYWMNFFLIWSIYENVIFRFTNGEYLRTRKNIDKYAYPISSTLFSYYKKYKEKEGFPLDLVLRNLMDDRCKAINFKNIRVNEPKKPKNTIEFRCPNGSLNSVIWQNNVNLFSKIIMSSKTSNLNNDLLIEKRREYLKNYNDYNDIYLYESLDFVDLIFDNNIDKLYFLRQYLKTFETSKKNYVKAKGFTNNI